MTTSAMARLPIWSAGLGDFANASLVMRPFLCSHIKAALGGQRGRQGKAWRGRERLLHQCEA